MPGDGSSLSEVAERVCKGCVNMRCNDRSRCAVPPNSRCYWAKCVLSSGRMTHKTASEYTLFSLVFYSTHFFVECVDVCVRECVSGLSREGERERQKTKRRKE